MALRDFHEYSVIFMTFCRRILFIYAFSLVSQCPEIDFSESVIEAARTSLFQKDVDIGAEPKPLKPLPKSLKISDFHWQY